MGQKSGPAKEPAGPHCQINGDKRERYQVEQTVTLP